MYGLQVLQPWCIIWLFSPEFLKLRKTDSCDPASQGAGGTNLKNFSLKKKNAAPVFLHVGVTQKKGTVMLNLSLLVSNLVDNKLHRSIYMIKPIIFRHQAALPNE